MPYDLEVTDTFAGEPNYAWVRRKIVPDNEPRALFKLLRELAGWPPSIRITTTAYGDGYEVRPRGLQQVGFVTYRETLPDEVTPESLADLDPLTVVGLIGQMQERGLPIKHLLPTLRAAQAALKSKE